VISRTPAIELPTRYRSHKSLPLAFAAIALTLLLSACGGGSSSESPTPPAPPGPPGTLDASFGNAGQVVTAIPIHAYPDAVALQSDGKIVISGYVAEAARESILLVRYDGTGTLDPTFGTGGKVVTAFGPGNARSNGLAIQADGKILVVGYSTVPGSCALFRYLASGAPDPTFGVSGVAEFEGTACGRLALQADGKPVVGSGQAMLLRFGTDGQLDPSFGSGGKADLNPLTGQYRGGCCDISIQRDGRIVAGVPETTGGIPAPVGLFEIRRLNTDGTIDSSCCKSVYYGNLAEDYSGSRVAIQGDGKILAALVYGKVERLTSDGALDPGFGTAGIADSHILGGLRGIALQPNGKIVLAGGDGTNLVLTRLLADGSLDTAFGNGGTAQTRYGSESGKYAALTLQADGRIIAVTDAYIPPVNLLTSRFFGDASP
jgi:uncharacterized delta-60 repeat protein